MINIWNFFLSPSSKITAEADKRQASIASFLLLVFSLLMIVLSIAIPYYLQDYSIYDHHHSVVFTTFVYIICYFLSRTRYYSIAIHIWAVLFIFALTNAMISDPKVRTISEASIFLIIITTVCSLTLNLRSTVIIGISIFLLLIALPIIQPAIRYHTLFIPGFVIVSNTVLAISGAIITSKDIEKINAIQKKAIDNAHQSGMADVASSVLHNVGNVLNSVVTSANCINERIENSSINGLMKAQAVLVENKNNLMEFISNDPKGIKLLEYIILVSNSMDADCRYIQEHSERLNDKIKIISEIILSQQKYAHEKNNNEIMSLENIINDSLMILENSIKKRDVKIIKEYKEDLLVDIQKTKLVHVLINIFKNALDSMDEISANNREIKIKMYEDKSEKFCLISDSGPGIQKENLGKIFTHGFTTKQNGHGFGLHASANCMTEMGGSLKAVSDGDGKGATFILGFK